MDLENSLRAIQRCERQGAAKLESINRDGDGARDGEADLPWRGARLPRQAYFSGAWSMRVAALILGLLGGMAGLGIAAMGDFLIGLATLQGPSSSLATIKFFLWAIPIASLVGGALAISMPTGAGTLMALSAIGWFAIGSHLGSGINFVTGSAIAFSGVGALVAFLGASTAGNRTAHISLSNNFVSLERAAPSDGRIEPSPSVDDRAVKKEPILSASPKTTLFANTLQELSSEAENVLWFADERGFPIELHKTTIVIQTADGPVSCTSNNDLLEFGRQVGYAGRFNAR